MSPLEDLGVHLRRQKLWGGHSYTGRVGTLKQTASAGSQSSLATGSFLFGTGVFEAICKVEPNYRQDRVKVIAKNVTGAS